MGGGLLDKRFIVVAGKGGVGRSTVALVVGRYAAARERRTLVCLTNAPPRYSDMLGGVLLDSTIRGVAEHLDVINLEPRSCREEYGLQVLRNRVLHGLVFGSRVVRAFLDAVPGLAEWAMLGKATYHVLDDAPKRDRYDLVVFDAPATGHGLDLLALPRAIVASIPTGRMRDEAQQRVELMSDPERCEVLPVTLPEEIPVNEAVELVAALERMGLNLERIVLNMIAGEEIDPEVAAEVDRAGASATLPPWMLPAAVALGRQRTEQESIARLSSLVPLPQIQLPAIAGSGLDEASILRLLRSFEDAL